MTASGRTRTIVDWAVLVAAFALAGAGAGLAARPGGAAPRPGGDGESAAAGAAAAPEGGAAGLPKIVLGGRAIDPALPIRTQVLAAAREYLGATVTVDAAGERREFSRAQLGATIPVARIAEEIDRALRSETPLRDVLERSAGEHRLPVIVDVRDDVALGHLLSFKHVFDREATPAKYDFLAGQVRPERVGRRLSLYRSLAALHDAFESGATEVSLAVQTVEPSPRAADIADADFSAVLGWYETPYARIEDQEARNFNLRHGAGFLDGTVVMPGRTLDFNATVGERSEVRGFKVAPVIAEGEMIDGIGGGTCQIASTTFAASFFAGLELGRRRPHSRPSSYILLGLDATVVYPSVNLEVTNPYDFPIAFHILVGDGNVRVEVRGARRVYEVTFIRDVYQVQPYPERVIDEPDWPVGAEVIAQRGIRGYRVRRHRVLCEGTACWRETAESHYPPTTHIVRRGTNASIPLAGFELPAGDTHRPYSADRHMMVTQTEDELTILRRP